MYVIERKKRIKESLKIVSDKEELILTVDLDIDYATQQYWKYYEKLHLCHEELKKEPNNAQKIELFGNAVLALCSFIFGEEQTKKIVEFYNERYTEIFSDILPFLTDVVFPMLKSESKKRAKQLTKVRGVK